MQIANSDNNNDSDMNNNIYNLGFFKKLSSLKDKDCKFRNSYLYIRVLPSEF